jgi:tRNA(adenine34) deaminase
MELPFFGAKSLRFEDQAAPFPYYHGFLYVGKICFNAVWMPGVLFKSLAVMRIRMRTFVEPLTRRNAIIRGASIVLCASSGSRWVYATSEHPDARWYQAAVMMKTRAESWGDQPYGAVIVLDGTLVGEGPSRVVKNQNPDAHAEREAIRDAQRRLGRANLAGSVLYSTSRPCSLCEAAAARAGVSRMYFGPSLSDGGPPRGGQE